jgi:lipopolysaccharide transport system ATP-binding protein
MDDIAIDVLHLGKRYRVAPSREFWALRDVRFTVRRGEAIAIIGANGAGKSTLLKILSRITEPTIGRAEIRGRVASLLEVGAGFHPELSGRENIYLNAAILGMRKAEIDRKLDAIVAFADVGAFLDTPIKHYSSGMRMRLAFAVAAHIEPEILIIDEVLAVGDAAFQRKCLGAMSDVTQGGRTVLFVSHNMSAVQRLCSRALVLTAGRVVADAETSIAVRVYLATTFDAADPSGDIEFLPRSREGMGDQVRLTHAVLLDAAGNATAELRFGERFSLRIGARSDSVYKELSLVVGVDAADGTRIATAISEESGSFFDIGPHSPLNAQATFSDLALEPGNYALTLSVRHGQHGLDHVVGFARFRVSEACAPGVAPPAAIIGYLRASASWQSR